MSVQSALLAVLTMGPAYGSQLQAEVLMRAAHRRQLNAGQVYATLDRLVDQGRAAPAGTTDDGLPLYALTAAGGSEAHEWLTSGRPDSPPDWDEMLDQVLVSATIESADPLAVIADYESAWRAKIDAFGVRRPDDDGARQSHPGRAEEDALGSAGVDRAAAAAAVLGAEAALAWLEQVRMQLLTSRETFTRVRPSSRPRRGRPAAG